MRLFTPGERAYAARRARSGAQSLAVRFAAKVAARRALGDEGLRWRDVEVVRGRSGAPTLRFAGRGAATADALGVIRTTVSLTHDPAWCAGQVILERCP